MSGEMRLLAPFSPSILRAEMPADMVAAVNARVDAILADAADARARDWSDNLVGRIGTEIRITDVIRDMPVFRDFLFDVARTFTQRCQNALLHYPNWETAEDLANKRLEIEIKEGWVNEMVAGDYNPVHFHQGCLFSSVGFLRIPDDYEAEFQADKARQNTVGCLQFIDSRTAVGVRNTYIVKPEVGILYLWPSWMLHCVYPFRSAGVRRSFAVNLSLQ